MKEPDRHDPVSARFIEIYCRTSYDVRVTVPPRKSALSGSQIRSTLQAHGFASTHVHSGSNLFRLSHGVIGQSDYVVIEVAPTVRPEMARVGDGESIIVPEETYPWVTLVWKVETFLRSKYGLTPDTPGQEMPPIIEVAVMALRNASDEP